MCGFGFLIYAALQGAATGQIGQVPPTADQDALSQILVDGLRETRASLLRGTLVWTRLTADDGFIPGRKLNTSGHYKLTFEGDSIALDAQEDVITTDSAGHASVTDRRQLAERWDGRLFYAAPGDGTAPKELAILTSPRFRLYHNLLGIVFRNALGNAGAITGASLVPESPDGVLREVSLVRHQGEQTIQVTYERGDNRTQAWYSLERGFYLIAEEWHENGALTYELNATLESIDGTWFPVTIEMISHGPDGKVALVNRFEVDRSLTSFNSEAPFADEGFRITARDGTEVSDYRFGDRLNYVVGRDVAGLEQLRALVEKARSLMKEGADQQKP